MPGWNGETNRVLMDLMAARDLGYETALLSPQKAALSRKAAEKGIRTYHFSFDNHPHRRLREILKLRRLLISEPAYIIHTHSSKDTWIVAQYIMLFGKKFHFIRTRHNSNRVRDSFFNRYLYRRIDRIVVVSDSVKQCFAHLAKKRVISADDIRIISSAVDTNRFRPSQEIRQRVRARLGVKPEEFLVGFVGRICEGKGIYHLLDALEVLLPREEKLKFVAVGECSEDDIMQKLASFNGQRVILPGFRKDVHDYYQAIDIFAMPSLKEGLPTSIIEAMACGKAIVAASVGGIPEIISHGQNGLLIPPRDPAAIVEAIQQLLKDESLRKKLSEAAQATAARNFSYEILNQKTKQLYQSMESADGS